ncbi:hypothetical protein BgiBS90_029471 [Biomphalaria glabrata]|nr:hypothetical protein BgiBS90_029471 [Biomphalaria glabrata]
MNISSLMDGSMIDGRVCIGQCQNCAEQKTYPSLDDDLIKTMVVCTGKLQNGAETMLHLKLDENSVTFRDIDS